jgi:hypothetical protein
VCSQLNAKKEINWTLPEGEIINVFECSKDAKKTEILRIYSSGEYEHLLYEMKTGNKEFVQRNLGKYIGRGKKVIFNSPTYKSFSGKFKYGTFYIKEHLYTSRKDIVFSKETPFMKSNFLYEYSKPFFMSLNSETIVHNKEAAAELNLEELVAFLIGAVETDAEKIDNIEWFIAQSIEYDEVGFETDILANDPWDINSILAGPNRTAVCSGYANTLSLLAEIAGIETQQIDGYSRSSFHQISKLIGYHVWTKVRIDGEYQLHDLTWADYGEGLDYTWINVDPSVMIGSHFPDHQEDQLLDTPYDQKSYLQTPCIVALAPEAVLVHSVIPATVFVDKTLTLTFEKNARVSIFRIEDDVLHEPKPFESSLPKKELYLFSVSDYHCDKTGDSAVYTLNLNSFKTVFSVEVNDAYTLLFIAVKGSEKDLLQDYATTNDDQHYDTYLKGILAAIKLKDYAKLKTLAGPNSDVFFDKKGQFKLNDSYVKTIEKWDGSISDLYELENKSTEKATDGKEVERTWNSYYAQIPHGLRFTLEMVDGHYSVSAIE